MVAVQSSLSSATEDCFDAAGADGDGVDEGGIDQV